MSRPIRIATTPHLIRSVREAGYEAVTLPHHDFNRSIRRRMDDGPAFRDILEKQNVDVVLDTNASCLTLLPVADQPNQAAITTAALGIPHVAHYIDPVTSTMAEASWMDHWHLLESQQWIKWVWDTAHAEELGKLGVPNVLPLPMAVPNDDFDTAPPPEVDGAPAVTFIGHPATSWFGSRQTVRSDGLFAGLLAAAVHADMPEVPFHSVYFDLYNLGQRPAPSDTTATRAERSRRYFDQKFIYNAWLALKQRDRFVIFLKQKLGDSFELVGDFWGQHYGLPHVPRTANEKEFYDRIRRVPICLNLMKGSLETSLILRHFEVTAAGGFLLTYPSSELAAHFEIGRECDVFRDEGELLEKIHYYLDHPRERREIALAGQRRTLSKHLYSHRIGRLVEILRGANILPRSAGQAAPQGGSAPVSAVAPSVRSSVIEEAPVETAVR